MYLAPQKSGWLGQRQNSKPSVPQLNRRRPDPGSSSDVCAASSNDHGGSRSGSQAVQREAGGERVGEGGRVSGARPRAHAAGGGEGREAAELMRPWLSCCR
jgi:hypothetical protein